MDLNQFLEIIRNMEPLPGREFKPHRYLALMAIIDIIEQQEENTNRFYYNNTFKQYFTKWFEEYHGQNDKNIPFKPFFHLKMLEGIVESFGFYFLCQEGKLI